MNPSSHRSGYRRLVLLCVVFSVLVGVFFIALDLFNRYYLAPLKLQKAYADFAAHKLNEAETEAWQAYQLNNRLAQGALLAAHVASDSGRYEQAIAYAVPLTLDGAKADTESRLEAYRLLAKLTHYRTYQLSQAETYYRATLSYRDDDVEAQTGLANLLGLCGRRKETIPLILNLVRNRIPTDLLFLLAREDTVVNDPELLANARTAAPNDRLLKIAEAWHLANAGQYVQAIELVRPLQDSVHTDDYCQQLILRYLAADGRFDELRAELVRLQSSRSRLEAWPDYWLACGQLAEHEQRLPEAIRCFGEAASRAPDSKLAISRLAVLLNRAGNAQAATFQAYAQDQQTLRDAQEQVLFATNRSSQPDATPMLEAYLRLGRVLEAIGWSRLMGIRNARIQEFEPKVASLPLSLVLPDQSPVRNLDLSNYPVPTWSNTKAMPVKPLASPAPLATATLTFRDDAAAAGLEFRYHNGVNGTPARRMFEFPGGGIAVLDLDQDGRPDLAMPQGTSWPPESQAGKAHDCLWHNVDGASFRQIDFQSLGFSLPDGFGQGIAAGDVNADGFPDLYIAETGQNHLLINKGDGTFQEVTTVAKIQDQQWTTSCMVADLTGDGLPDLFDVNYVSGRDVFHRVCADHTGQPAMCMPGDFDAANQVLWVNQGDGTFTNGTDRLLPLPQGKGLGCLAFSLPGQLKLSLLVANDTTPNFLYIPVSDGNRNENGNDHDRNRNGRDHANEVLTEAGVLNGVAFSAAGKAQGSMGIASDDINGDGQLDFVVTNFLNESSAYYCSQGDRTYRDESVATGLIEPTRNVLGFGSQFIDVDNDGVCELFMANGHIDDLRRRNVPYQMPQQLFQFSEGRFRLVPANSLGDYFQRQLVGRSVVRIDWNMDGRQDLVVGHLHEPYALLTNTSADAGNWLSIQLVGTYSDRDAIGTQVTVIAGQIRQTRQLTAGDGYMASNQRRLHFGLGKVEQADRIEVRWPSGQTQELEHVSAGSRLLIVEQAKHVGESLRDSQSLSR